MLPSRFLLVVLAFATGALVASGGTLSISNQTASSGINVKYSASGLSNPEYIAPAACGDFDNDGDQDVIHASGGGANGADKFYVNQGNGTFVDQAAAFGLTTVHRGLSFTIGDFDDDGFLDIYSTSAGPSGTPQSGQNKLYRNVNGTGFTNVAASAGLTGAASDSYGSSAGDYNLDGRLDLLVTGFNTHVNRLYRNNGNLAFSDVTASAGIASGLSLVYGFATRFCDTNGDRYPELLVCGDFGTSRYFRNNGNGTFTNWTVPSGTAKDENGMGATIGDFDRDGDVDWYVTSIHSVFTPGWTGNKLYRNNGAHSFTEISASAGVNDGGYGWGAVGIDFDHDKWVDIAETNGAQWSSEYMNERSYLWRNNGNNTFTDVSAASGFNELGQGRGLINFDYDLDGDQDLLITRNNEFTQLWRNDLSGPNIHWLRVTLDTKSDPGVAPNGYGSVVRVKSGGVTQTAFLFGGDNVQSQSELTCHFGLGADTKATEVSVEWTDGRVTKWFDVAADQTIAVQSAFTFLGGGVAGTGAVTPGLTGSGTLVAGSPTTIRLTGAQPNAACTLFVGLSALNAPLYGGTFIPSPTIYLPFVADGTGSIPIVAPWPAGLPAAFPMWMQYWCVDAGAQFGASASNGIKALTP